MGVPEEKFFVNIQDYGNTSAASIPIALYEALEEGRAKLGDNLALVAFGAGLTWAASVVRIIERQPRFGLRTGRWSLRTLWRRLGFGKKNGVVEAQEEQLGGR